MKQRTQTYNDGILNIYRVGNIAEKGNIPKEGLVLKTGPIRYSERTVGMSRYWTAKQAQVKIELLIRIPKVTGISTQDVVKIGDDQYSVLQIQNPTEVVPPSMDLSLQRLEAKYDITEIQGLPGSD